MILFLGTRARTRPVGEGTFHCPYCYQPRTYTRSERRTWVHLFWVPVLPLGQAREDVQCSVCGGRWAPDVLGAAPLG